MLVSYWELNEVRKMKIKIKLLKPFSDIAGCGELDLDFQGDNIQNALDSLCKLHPGLSKELFDEK